MNFSNFKNITINRKTLLGEFGKININTPH